MYAHRIIHQHRLDVWVWIHLAVCLWCVKPLGTMTHEEKSQTVPKFDNNFKAQCVLFNLARWFRTQECFQDEKPKKNEKITHTREREIRRRAECSGNRCKPLCKWSVFIIRWHGITVNIVYRWENVSRVCNTCRRGIRHSLCMCCCCCWCCCHESPNSLQNV